MSVTASLLRDVLHAIVFFLIACSPVLPGSSADAGGDESASKSVGLPSDQSVSESRPELVDETKSLNKSVEPEPTIDLIVPDLTRYWQCYNSDAKAGMSDVWRIVESGGDASPSLICTGQPKGFLYTIEKYADFELTLEWKFPTDANGNSGVLVYLQDEPRIWPTSMQIQFHQPKAGSVFPSGDAKSANTSEADLAGPVNSWNSCRIVSKAGQLSVEVNGKKAGETTGSVPASGSIALQSEGAEVHFRRIRVRRLTPDEQMPVDEGKPAPVVAPAAEPGKP